MKKIEHIGIAVKNLEKSIPLFEKILETKCYKIEVVEKQNVKTAFFQIGETKIELLEATSQESPIAKFIQKKGEGIHHIAFLVEDIERKIKELESLGFQIIDKVPPLGAEGFLISFLHPSSTNNVLIEICSKNNQTNKEEE